MGGVERSPFKIIKANGVSMKQYYSFVMRRGQVHNSITEWYSFGSLGQYFSVGLTSVI